MCLTSKRDRILPQIQWTWFQTRDTCISRVRHVFFILVKKIVLIFCKFPTLVLDDLHMSALHKNGVEFHREFSGHGPTDLTHVIHISNICFSFWYSKVCNIFANFYLWFYIVEMDMFYIKMG